ncbi:MAG: hypothetical protein LBV38_06740 [Alistipes sp.]|nr:hypothetical protein [Alistipes sp.]
MVLIIIVVVCGVALLFALTGCNRDSSPDITEATNVTQIGERLKPFVWRGEIHYEKFVWENREVVVDSVQGAVLSSWQIERHTFVLDSRGRQVSEIAEADETKVPRRLTSDSGTKRVFIGVVDPVGRLLYAHRYHARDMGIYMYDVATGRPAGFVELVSIPTARAFAIEHRNSEMLNLDTRERLERAGCVLPPREKVLRWNTEVFRDEAKFRDTEAWQNMNTAQKLIMGARRMSAQNDEEKRFRRVLVEHFDAIEPEYEAAISRFVADNVDGAYVYTAYSYVYDEGSAVEYVVLPDKGFAFEVTAGMTLGDLPRATAAPTGDSGGDSGVSIRRTGRHSWLRFEPVAFIPLWKLHTIYRYRLAIGDEQWTLWDSSSSLKILDLQTGTGGEFQAGGNLQTNGAAGDSVYFSLIDGEGLVQLYSLKRSE